MSEGTLPLVTAHFFSLSARNSSIANLHLYSFFQRFRFLESLTVIFKTAYHLDVLMGCCNFSVFVYVIRLFNHRKTKILIALTTWRSFYKWAASSEKVHSIQNAHLDSPCACAKSRPGVCSPLIHSIVSNDSVN